MNLQFLYEMERGGALKADEDVGGRRLCIGGQVLNENDAAVFVGRLGWTRLMREPIEAVKATRSFVTNMKQAFLDTGAASRIDMVIEDGRVKESDKRYERILLSSPYGRFSVIHGRPGLGGAYAVFDLNQSNSRVDFSCRTYKNLCSYFVDVVKRNAI